MSNGLHIRPAERGDIPHLEALYLRSLRKNPDGFIQDVDFHGDMGNFIDTAFQRGGGTYAAIHDGEIIGMGTLMPCQSTPHAINTTHGPDVGQNDPGPEVEICRLHVEASRQGQGFGRQLCEWLMAEAQTLGFGKVVLHVTTTQTAAIALYRKLGFHEDKTEVWSGNINGTALSFETLFMHKLIEATQDREGDREAGRDRKAGRQSARGPMRANGPAV